MINNYYWYYYWKGQNEILFKYNAILFYFCIRFVKLPRLNVSLSYFNLKYYGEM